MELMITVILALITDKVAIFALQLNHASHKYCCESIIYRGTLKTENFSCCQLCRHCWRGGDKLLLCHFSVFIGVNEFYPDGDRNASSSNVALRSPETTVNPSGVATEGLSLKKVLTPIVLRKCRVGVSQGAMLIQHIYGTSQELCIQFAHSLKPEAMIHLCLHWRYWYCRL